MTELTFYGDRLTSLTALSPYRPTYLPKYDALDRADIYRSTATGVKTSEAYRLSTGKVGPVNSDIPTWDNIGHEHVLDIQISLSPTGHQSSLYSIMRDASHCDAVATYQKSSPSFPIWPEGKDPI
jgi:hypothetical protein